MKVGELLVKIGADNSNLKRGVRESKRELATLPEEKTVHIKVKKSGTGNSFLETDLADMQFKVKALIALLPLLSSAAAVAAGSLGGLASMLGAVTTGTVGAGAVAVAVLNDVFDAQKNITKAQQDYEKATTKEEQKTALENLQQAYIGLNEGQLAALGSLQKFKSAWEGFTSRLQSGVVVGFVSALEGLQTFLSNVEPAIKSAVNAFAGVFQKMNAALKNADFKKFFDWLSTTAGPTISTFGDIFINVLQGVFNLMRAFQPVSDSMQGGLLAMSQAFLQWTQSIASSDAFKQFINYVLTTGPMFLQLIKNLTISLYEVVRGLAPIGTVMLGVLNIGLALANLVLELIFGFGDFRGRVDDVKNSIIGFGNAIKGLLGFQADTINQTSAVSDLDKAYQDMVGSIGDVGGGLQDAKKDADKFLAAFDEVYQVPDQLDSITPPTLPAPSAPPAPSSGGATGGNNTPQEQTNWLQKLIDKVKEFPLVVSLMKFDPPDFGLGAVITAIEGLPDKITTMLKNMANSWATNSVPILLGLAALSAALAFPTVAASLGFATMLTTMINDLNANKQPILEGLQSLLNKMGELKVSTDTMRTAWHTMLDYMQSQLNAYVPYLVFGLALIGLELTSDLIPAMDNTQLSWHTMLDYMQSQLNAYNPYLLFGIGLLILKLVDLQNELKTTEEQNATAWDGMESKVSTRTAQMVREINAVTAAINAMNAAMGQSPVSSAVPSGAAPMGDNEWERPPVTAPMGDNEWVSTPAATKKLSEILMNGINGTDFGPVLADAAKSFGEFGVDSGLALTGLKSIQIGSKIGQAMLPKLLQILKNALSGGLSYGGAFATGGIVGTDSLYRLGEGNKREAVIPLESGAMNPFADAVASRIGAADGGSGSGRSVYIGVLDEAQLKQWARQLKLIQIREDQRGLNA